MIITRTPFRITLGGGGTDLPSYYENNGGLVVSMAIDKYLYITLKPDDFEHLCKVRYSEIESVVHASLLRHTRAREALLMHGICDGIEINSCADLSASSGMGSSGTFLVGLLKAIREYKRISTEPSVVAEEACYIEINTLKEPVGKQDQYIASHGGVKVLDIAKDGKVTTSALDMDLGDFLRNVHVYSLNVKRNASEILSDQQKLLGNTESILNTIKEYGYRTIDLLKNKNYDEYGLLLDDYWKLKKQLSPKVSLDLVDQIYDKVKIDFGVLGGKIIGAGGGGFLMLYTPDGHDKLEAFMKSLGMWRLRYAIDYTGSRVIGNHLENKIC